MRWKLPPLILHPFADASGTGKVVEAARATLVLRGLISGENGTAAELDERLLAGRYCEIVMLFYVGKDLERWVSQCIDFAGRTPGLRDCDLEPNSFVLFLVEDAPAEVREKLDRWGVREYSTIFARALGIHAIFAAVPPTEILAPDFIRNYHDFADSAYACRLRPAPRARIDPAQFEFDLYASGEYSRMLEQEWAAE